MSSAIESKKLIVDEIADKLKNSKSTIVVDYRGLTVGQVTELRKQLREAGIDLGELTAPPPEAVIEGIGEKASDAEVNHGEYQVT